MDFEYENGAVTTEMTDVELSNGIDPNVPKPPEPEEKEDEDDM